MTVVGAGLDAVGRLELQALGVGVRLLGIEVAADVDPLVGGGDAEDVTVDPADPHRRHGARTERSDPTAAPAFDGEDEVVVGVVHHPVHRPVVERLPRRQVAVGGVDRDQPAVAVALRVLRAGMPQVHEGAADQEGLAAVGHGDRPGDTLDALGLRRRLLDGAAAVVRRGVPA